MFQLIGVNDYTVEYGDRSIQVGELTKAPFWSKRSKVGTRAIWARDIRSFLTYVRDNYPTPRHAGTSDKPNKGSKFHSFESFNYAMDVFINDPHLIRKFNQKEDDIIVEDNLGNEVYFDVTGDYINIGRFMDGDPEHFGNMYMGNPESVFATIMLNISAPAHVDPAVLARRSERVLRLVDWLESQHIRTQILAIKANECTYLELTLKQFHDPVNLDSMAIVCHNDFLRRTLFRVAEYSKTYVWSYGLASMVNNGLMKPPINRDAHVLVLSEAQETVELTDELFDKAERTIMKNLSEGENRFSILT